MSLSTPTVSEEEKKRHQELFKRNHVLAPRNLNIDSPNASYNDSADLTAQVKLSPLTATQVENDPKTPHYRKQFAQQRTRSNSFSPVPTAIKHNSNHDDSVIFQSSTPDSTPNPQKPSLTNRLLQYAPNNISSTPSQNRSESKVVPGSILKKSINYDRDTSRRLVQLKPELSSALNSEGELNPLKASKSVVISPKKEYFSNRSSHIKSSKFASPLTDTLNGNSRRIKSPYLKSPKKKTKTSQREWIDEIDEEHKPKDKKNSKNAKEQTPFWKDVLKSLVDPQLPYVLSLYLQLIFNVIIVSILVYFIYSFISTVRADVENKVDSYAADILQEIAVCSREYLRNYCQPGQRAVALEAACTEWEKCMNRDPTTVGRAKIGAETFAEIINGFIKPISWKSMFFLLLLTVGSLVLTNAAFGTYRNYSHYDHQPHLQQPQIPQIPQTPSRQTLSYNPNLTHYYTPKATSPTSVALVRNQRKSSVRKLKK